MAQGVTSDVISVLSVAVSTERRKARRFMQNSFPADTAITPPTNGLVDATIHAWNTRHHLVLRPDDIWLAIISQLGFYIDAHAEELRAFFVAHNLKDKKDLVVEQDAHPDHADYGQFKFATQMCAVVARNVNDAMLVLWVIPGFLTTTDVDCVAAAAAAVHRYSWALWRGILATWYTFACATWAAVPVIVVWKDAGVVVEDRKCRMVAGPVGMRPGKYAGVGVRLDGSEPPRVSESRGGSGPPMSDLEARKR
ncbi:hypothetical protein QBC34DRAFT_475270 [Podospora aff. communis PSN243]|uniref:Uncharacterized protein n=1 Tax=Podospora aff. communis PSN243 TaxID=3040156 RepID=A0AAV9G746_9PEZI|nr:hypothetical protein QBC34DRAFT_475270 [Podospora aff. communis PSN243]